ncbi:MAG: copper-binding protein, partial [Chitinimonas sp.]|nr:copper-binding protein [Chitinimonas sp.]
RVKDAAFLDQVKPGDKVRFKVEKLQDGYTITAIQTAS